MQPGTPLVGHGPLGLHQAGVAAVDTTTGEKLWSAAVDDIHTGSGDNTVEVEVSPDSSTVFLAGDDCREERACEFTTVAVRATGGHGKQWVSRFDGGGRGYLADLAMSPDGASVIVTGQESMPCYAGCEISRADSPVVSYDAATGEQRWVTTYPDSTGAALAVSRDSASVFMVGSLTAAGAVARPSAARTTSCGNPCGYATARLNAGDGPGVRQDSDVAVRYDGWRGVFDRTAIGGAYRASKRRGDVATFVTPKVPKLTWLTHQGPNQGKARVVIDGKPRGTFNLYSRSRASRAVSFDQLSRRRHTVQVQVLGTKGPSSKGNWVAVDGFSYRVGDGLTQESSPTIRYNAWNGVTTAAARGGSLRLTATPGATMRHTFTGRSLTWLTATAPAAGRARVVVDGRTRVVDLYRPTRHARTAIDVTGLGKGTHSLVLTVLPRSNSRSSGRDVAVDALIARR